MGIEVWDKIDHGVHIGLYQRIYVERKNRLNVLSIKARMWKDHKTDVSGRSGRGV